MVSWIFVSCFNQPQYLLYYLWNHGTPQASREVLEIQKKSKPDGLQRGCSTYCPRYLLYYLWNQGTLLASREVLEIEKKVETCQLHDGPQRGCSTYCPRYLLYYLWNHATPQASREVLEIAKKVELVGAPCPAATWPCDLSVAVSPLLMEPRRER